MQDVFDIYTIIFLALAVFIFLRLRSVLGQRTGRERPPYDPYSAPDPIRNSPGDKVIPLPQRTSEPAKPPETSEPADHYAGIAAPGSAVARGLDAIMAADKGFKVWRKVSAFDRSYFEVRNFLISKSIHLFGEHPLPIINVVVVHHELWSSMRTCANCLRSSSSRSATILPRWEQII